MLDATNWVNTARESRQLFNSGALDLDPDAPPSSSRPARVLRESIFKLSWVEFPDQAALANLLTSLPAGGVEPPSLETASYVERGESLLVVLGGQLATDLPGVSVLQFPQYHPPATNVRVPSSPGLSISMSAAVRSAFRDSLSLTGSTFYPTASPCDDFLLLPRSNPFFSLSFDPSAIVFLLGPDPTLPTLPAPNSLRGVRAHTFPPVRSNDAPLSPGRKEFGTPGTDAHLVPMTAAPVLASFNAVETMPQTPRTPASPWLSVFGSGPTAIAASPSKVGPAGFGDYLLPTGLWSGSASVLGCELVSPPRDSFRRVVRWEADMGAKSDVPRLNLRGGMMEPDIKMIEVKDMKVR